MVLAFRTFSNIPSINVLIIFNSLLYFPRYAPEKLLIVKIERGSNSLNTGDRVSVFAFCNSPHGSLSLY